MGWPSIFYVNLPVSLAVVAVTVGALEAGGRLRLPDGRWLVESALLAGAGTALVGGVALSASRGLAWLAAALVAVPLAAAWSRLRSSRPVTDLLRAPGLALLLCVGGVSGVQFLAPFYLQQALRAGTAVTGLVVLAQPLGMALTSPLGGYLADRGTGSWPPPAQAPVRALAIFS